jgi:hypothetical protein
MKNLTKIIRIYFSKDKNSKRKSKLNLDDTLVKFNEFKSKYHDLIKKCHPDKFKDPKQRIIAEEYTKRINSNRYNFKILVEIEKEINEYLL